MSDDNSAPINTDDDQASSDVGTVSDQAAQSADDLVVEDLLVEEISIDGMCGVY